MNISATSDPIRIVGRNPVTAAGNVLVTSDGVCDRDGRDIFRHVFFLNYYNFITFIYVKKGYSFR